MYVCCICGYVCFKISLHKYEEFLLLLKTLHEIFLSSSKYLSFENSLEVSAENHINKLNLVESTTSALTPFLNFFFLFIAPSRGLYPPNPAGHS